MGWTSGRGREAARCGRDATVETTNTSSSGQVRIFATDGPKCGPAVISGTYAGTSDTRCAGTSDTGYAGTGDRSTSLDWLVSGLPCLAEQKTKMTPGLGPNCKRLGFPKP